MKLYINIFLLFSLLSIVYAIIIEQQPSQSVYKRGISRREDSSLELAGSKTTISHLQYFLHTSYHGNQNKSEENAKDKLHLSNQICYLLERDIIDLPSHILIGFVLLLTGFYFMIFGVGWLRITLFLTGFVTFGLMAWIGLPYPEVGYHKVIYLFSDLSFGVTGGFIFEYLDLISVCFIGGLGGVFIAIYLVLSSFLVFEMTFVPLYLTICLCLIFGMLCYLKETYCFILSTSFIGSYLATTGLNLLLFPSFQVIDPFRDIICHQNTAISVVVAHVIVILLFMASYIWQYYWNIITKEFHVKKEGAVYLS